MNGLPEIPSVERVRENAYAAMVEDEVIHQAALAAERVNVRYGDDVEFYADAAVTTAAAVLARWFDSDPQIDRHEALAQVSALLGFEVAR